MSKFTKEYQNFFLRSDAGQEFMKFVLDRVAAEVGGAKNKPEEARDRMQRVKGLDEIVEHINSVCFERKPIGAE